MPIAERTSPKRVPGVHYIPVWDAAPARPIAPKAVMRGVMGFTAKETALVEIIAAAPGILFGDLCNHPEMKNADKTMHQRLGVVRRKLAEHGVEITSGYRKGYAILGESLAKWKALLGGADAA